MSGSIWNPGTGSSGKKASERLVISIKDFPYLAYCDGVHDDTESVAAAVAYCHASGDYLWWPSGVVLTTVSIPNLHDVVHVGPGVISRDGNIFYINPVANNANVLYVSAAGNDLNDGLSAAQPFATVQAALDVLAAYGPELDGVWTIQVAAGAYTEGEIDFPVGLSNRARIIIQGPAVGHPNVPTAVFSNAALAYGLNFNSRALVIIRNLKFLNYSTYGIVAQDFADLYCDNVHLQGIAGDSGIKVQQGRLRFYGGIITSCKVGISCISGTTFTIGDPAAASLANGTQITGCTQAGILAQEQSSGHADYVTIDNCAIGLETVIHSRFNATSCDIKNNATAGVRCRQSSDWYNNGSTFTGNTNNELMYSFGGEVVRDGDKTSELRCAVDLTYITNTGVIGATTVKTYASDIGADRFAGQSKAYRIKIYGTLTGTAGTKNITVNAGGSAVFGFTIPAAAVGDFVIEGIMYAYNVAGNQQSYYATCMVNGQALQVAQGSRSINMMTGAAVPVTVQETINGASDTISIRGVDRYCIGGF